MTKKKTPKLNVVETKVKVDPDLILQNLVEQFCSEHAKSCQHLKDYEAPQILFDQFYWLSMFHLQMCEKHPPMRHLIIGAMLQGIAAASQNIEKYEQEQNEDKS